MGDLPSHDAILAELERLVPKVEQAIAGAVSTHDLDQVHATYLGRQDGAITKLRKSIGQVADIPTKKLLGAAINEKWNALEEAFRTRTELLHADEERSRIAGEWIDLTIPEEPLSRGTLHPITEVLNAIRQVFGSLGYRFVEGPEVEYDRYNFTFVNMPPDHPSRDTQDTYFIDDTRLLRTQTSSVQVRAMRVYGAPMSAIVIGRCFRRDNDATHAPIFYQAEGICIDTDISLADLKGTLLYFMQSFFGTDRKIRLRPHHFPFTEPSFEIDISCMRCNGSGCSLCRKSGWIEVLGSGMIHPTVLENGGIDPSRYRGFAFGVGLERMAMLKYNIQHIRHLYENDIRFLTPRREA